jgi:cytochrome P450
MAMWLKALEDEDPKLTKLLAEQMLDMAAMKEGISDLRKADLCPYRSGTGQILVRQTLSERCLMPGHLHSALPIQAEMAKGRVSLLTFLGQAGRNLLSVIPEETKSKRYVRGPARLHYVCDPAIITAILVDRPEAFPKSQVTKNILGSAIGNGMILSEGPVWKAQRRRYAPLFAARNLPVLARHFAETGLDLARRLAAARGEVDIVQLAQEATLGDISRVMFSGSRDVDAETVRSGLKRYTEHVADMSFFDLLGFPTWVPRLKWLKSKAPVTEMRNLARRVVTDRQAAQREEPEDFLDLMVAALTTDGEDIETTVDNLLTFVVAGHETAANTLAWALYLLALYPDVQNTLRAEIRTHCPDGPITFEATQKMERLNAHVSETMRLYPAAAFFARDAATEITLGGITFRKGDAIYFPIYALHRHQMLWEDPDAYQADRFLKTQPERGQFLPFGDGPRVCIGAQYARTEIMVLLASLLREVEFAIGSGTIPRPVVTITMHPDGPLFLKVAKVKGAPT